MDKDEKKRIRDGVKAASEQVGFQDMPPNVVDKVKSDGERLYELYQFAQEENGVGSDNFVALDDGPKADWESFAKILFTKGAMF